MSLPKYFCAIDTETTGLNRWRGARPFAAAAWFPNGQTLFWREDFQGTFRQICEDPTIDKVFMNAKYDWGMIETQGITLRGKIWDVSINCHLLDGRDAEGGLSLDAMTRKYLPAQYRKVTTEIYDWFMSNGFGKIGKKGKKDGFRGSFQDLPNDILQRRVVGDATLTGLLFTRTLPTVQKIFPYLLDMENRLIPIVKTMEDRGALIDTDEVLTQMEELSGVVEDVCSFCAGVLGDDCFNINSPHHQRDLLKEAGIYELITEWTKPAKKRKSKKPFVPQRKMDAYNLMQLHHPVSAMLMVGKMAKKMISPFLTQAMDLSIDEVLRASFKQTGTVTGRFSCSEPNLQNIPTEGDRKSNLQEHEAEELYDLTGYRLGQHIKRIFRVRSGYMHIHADKKQAEMVALAHYTGDQSLLDIFSRGISVHDGICALMFPNEEVTKGLKQKSKSVTFGYIYGMALKSLSRKFQGDIGLAKTMRSRLERTFPGLPRWNAELFELVSNQGFVQTIHGRRHYLYPNESYMAVNRVCQGHVGDEVKGRMVAIGEYLAAENIDARILLNIHDDLCVELPEELGPVYGPRIFEIMQQSDIPCRLPMPSSLDVTFTRWSDLKEVKDPTDGNAYRRLSPCSTASSAHSN